MKWLKELLGRPTAIEWVLIAALIAVAVIVLSGGALSQG